MSGRRTALVVPVPEAQALFDAWRDRWDLDRIVPHLTIVNRSPPRLLDEVARAVMDELPIQALVREATLLEEGEDGVWRLAAAFPLAQRLPR